MPTGRAPADDDVYSLTSRGDGELKAARTSLSPVELGILVLVDGQATVKQIARSAGATVPRSQVDAALRTLLDKQLIIAADEPSALESGFFKFTPSLAPLATAHPEAEEGVASLRNKGYYVRIARSAPKKRELPQGRQPRVLLVDDDTDLVR